MRCLFGREHGLCKFLNGGLTQIYGLRGKARLFESGFKGYRIAPRNLTRQESQHLRFQSLI